MSGGALFANANIIMHGDTYLLTRKRIREMVAATSREALLHVLAECGYQTNFDDDATLLHTEREKTLQKFCELCDDPALCICVQAWDTATESSMVTAFTTIAAHLPKIKNAAVREYFITLIDMLNVRTFYKGGKTLLPGGQLAANQLNIYKHLTPAEIQTAIDQKLTNLGAVAKDDIFQINPLFWWYLQKQKEFIVVKTILICKRCHYDAATIRQNIGGLYEQFK